MKKNFIKLFIFVLMFIVPIFSVNAADYNYKNAYYDVSGYNGYSSYNINTGKSHNSSDGKFWIHQAYSGKTYIHAYCLNVGMTANTNYCTGLDHYTLKKDITLADGKKLTQDQVDMLKQVYQLRHILVEIYVLHQQKVQDVFVKQIEIR